MKKIFKIGMAATAVLAALSMQSCKSLYGKYERPAVNTSGLVRDPLKDADTLAVTDTTSFANIPWRSVFTDPQLQALIQKGLDHNPNLLNAALNVEIAEAQLKAAKLAFLPSLAFSPQGVISSWDGNKATKTYSLPIAASWNIDLFGNFVARQNGSKLRIALCLWFTNCSVRWRDDLRAVRLGEFFPDIDRRYVALCLDLAALDGQRAEGSSLRWNRAYLDAEFRSRGFYGSALDRKVFMDKNPVAAIASGRGGGQLAVNYCKRFNTEGSLSRVQGNGRILGCPKPIRNIETAHGPGALDVQVAGPVVIDGRVLVAPGYGGVVQRQGLGVGVIAGGAVAQDVAAIEAVHPGIPHPEGIGSDGLAIRRPGAVHLAGPCDGARTTVDAIDCEGAVVLNGAAVGDGTVDRKGGICGANDGRVGTWQGARL